MHLASATEEEHALKADRYGSGVGQADRERGVIGHRLGEDRQQLLAFALGARDLAFEARDLDPQLLALLERRHVARRRAGASERLELVEQRPRVGEAQPRGLLGGEALELRARQLDLVAHVLALPDELGEVVGRRGRPFTRARADALDGVAEAQLGHRHEHDEDADDVGHRVEQRVEAGGIRTTRTAGHQEPSSSSGTSKALKSSWPSPGSGSLAHGTSSRRAASAALR